MIENYFLWYTVSQALFFVTLLVWPNLYLSVPLNQDADSISDARRIFAELATTSIFPLAREFAIINWFFFWLAAKRFPVA